MKKTFSVKETEVLKKMKFQKGSVNKRGQIIRDYIYEGYTLNTIAEAMGLAIPTIVNYLRKYYTKDAWYRKALNRASKNAAEGAENEFRSRLKYLDEEAKEAESMLLIAESGAWLSNLEELQKQSLPLFIPIFCIGELEKVYKYGNKIDSAKAESALMFIVSNNIPGLKMPQGDYEDLLMQVPPTNQPISRRALGLVALGLEHSTEGKHVQLFTNSFNIKNLIELQGDDDLQAIYLP